MDDAQRRALVHAAHVQRRVGGGKQIDFAHRQIRSFRRLLRRLNGWLDGRLNRRFAGRFTGRLTSGFTGRLTSGFTGRLAGGFTGRLAGGFTGRLAGGLTGRNIAGGFAGRNIAVLFRRRGGRRIRRDFSLFFRSGSLALRRPVCGRLRVLRGGGILAVFRGRRLRRVGGIGLRGRARRRRGRSLRQVLRRGRGHAISRRLFNRRFLRRRRFLRLWRRSCCRRSGFRGGLGRLFRLRRRRFCGFYDDDRLAFRPDGQRAENHEQSQRQAHDLLQSSHQRSPPILFQDRIQAKYIISMKNCQQIPAI